ncbi:hypothetical protein MSAN_01123600 [Mycena sanguinolenta]|uniref:Uncharacterized protein n=1 Tax=Mycena sanguinolenta TaxID=230812 RepID=A0A8H6YN58_9AGAR|nr:hypothetical protein MSAN_01123600 [Mycena sanguinolenta]
MKHALPPGANWGCACDGGCRASSASKTGGRIAELDIVSGVEGRGGRKRLPTNRILHIAHSPPRRAPAHPRGPGSNGHIPPSLASSFDPILSGLSAPCFAPEPMSPGGKERPEKELEAGEVLFLTINDFGGFAGLYEEYLRDDASIREGIVGTEGARLTDEEAIPTFTRA